MARNIDANDPWDGDGEAISKAPAARVSAKQPAFARGISAADLMAKHFEPINYVIPGFLAEGVTVLAGSPKLGKSWLCLDFAEPLASGRPVFGSVPITQGDVLYLALEDSERRLKSRMLKRGSKGAERLTLLTEWPDLDNGCIAELEAWADSVERPTLVIVDVLNKVRGQSRGDETLYSADYRALTGLGNFARQRAIAVIVVHHVRKMAADDPLESVSGTNGLTGAADSVMILKREVGTVGTGNATLYVRGRDIEETETVLRFNQDIGTWERIGAAGEVGRTNEREAIMAELRSSSKPLSAREVSDLLGKKYDSVRKTMTRMAQAGEIEKRGHSQYTCPNCPNVPNRPQMHNDWDTGTPETWDIGEDDFIQIWPPLGEGEA